MRRIQEPPPGVIIRTRLQRGTVDETGGELCRGLVGTYPCAVGVIEFMEDTMLALRPLFTERTNGLAQGRPEWAFLATCRLRRWDPQQMGRTVTRRSQQLNQTNVCCAVQLVRKAGDH